MIKNSFFIFILLITITSYSDEINDLINSISPVWADEGEPGIDEAYEHLESNLMKLDKYYSSNPTDIQIPLTLYKGYDNLMEKFFYKYSDEKSLSEPEYIKAIKSAESKMYSILITLLTSKDSSTIDVLRLAYHFNPRRLQHLSFSPATIDSIEKKKTVYISAIIKNKYATVMDTLSFLDFSNHNNISRTESLEICRKVHSIDYDNYNNTNIIDMIFEECKKCSGKQAK